MGSLLVLSFAIVYLLIDKLWGNEHLHVALSLSRSHHKHLVYINSFAALMPILWTSLSPLLMLKASFQCMRAHMYTTSI